MLSEPPPWGACWNLQKHQFDKEVRGATEISVDGIQLAFIHRCDDERLIHAIDVMTRAETAT